MSADANPYQSPPEIVQQETIERPEGRFWGGFFWGAVGFTCVGFLAIFVRNLPPIGFLLVGAVLYLITIIGSKQNRKRAIVGLVLCLVTGVFGFYQLRSMQAILARDQALRAQRAAYEAAMAAEEVAVSEYERVMIEADSSEAEE